MDPKQARVAVLVEQQYQEMEVWYPVYRLREAGCKVTLVGPEAGTTYPSKLGYPAKSDRAAKDVNPDDFDVVVIPGGFAPDFLRRHEATLRFVRGWRNRARSSRQSATGRGCSARRRHCRGRRRPASSRSRTTW